MRRLPLLLAALLVSFATTAMANEGVNLRWTDCYGDGGVFNRNFACNTNSGTNVLVGSFELGTPMSPVSGQEIRIDLLSASPTLPAWWSFRNPTTCRMTSMSMNLTIPVSAANCVDWASGQAAGGLAAYNIGYLAPNRARIVAAVAVPQTALANLDAGQEYFLFQLAINNAKTVGAAKCAGCSTPANLWFTSLKVTTPVAANDRVISNPTNGNDSYLASWQGGFPVAARRQTWGAVKALYR